VIRADTAGKIEAIDAKYELLQRGQYQRLSNPLNLKADRRIPLELYEARNAVQIARSVGAGQFAAETFRKAEKSLSEAEAYQARNAGKKPVTMSAREAVQMAEDSRAIAVKRQEQDALAAERQGSQDREARSESGRVAAMTETERVTRDAEAAKVAARAHAEQLTREKDAQAATASLEADRVKRDNDARVNALAMDADRMKTENQAREMAAKTEADRLKAENDSHTAAAGAEANRLKQENDAQRAGTQNALDTANQQNAKLEAQKADLRVLLLAQFNAILQTRDTARGLIVNMSDVLFDTAKFTLRPLAREKLAKVAGIVSGHPGLKLDVEGHTDSVGGDQYNQTLSEQRGSSVRDYLMLQGMAVTSVTTKGFGKTQPVASNDTAEGRQENRRVEIVISGDIIGTEIGKIVAAR
jgi:outer membrane protein OmpA-like peptidoglycan-associated protein